MKDYKHISFSPSMIQAILEGNKTQTRRIIKLPVIEKCTWAGGAYIEEKNGDRAAVGAGSEDLPSKYKKGDILLCHGLFLEVTNVRAERLQDISEEDAISEGCPLYGPFGEYRGSLHPNGGQMRYRAYGKASRAFQCVWETIYGEGSWKVNPWVFVYEFKRTITKPSNF